MTGNLVVDEAESVNNRSVIAECERLRKNIQIISDKNCGPLDKSDDNFTIIAPGTHDIDRDGASLVGDPDLGFQGLKHFGPVLVHRTQLKIRKDTQVKDFCVVDSPGMIDSPVVKDHFGSGKHQVMDRGYDFEGVCRWYAERADVILLFFDPDKPGTTGETLSILTNSLKGLDHKLHLILNKADQFRKIHDFARAYGSLCWNLSKVIPRKDLPQIHTMCLPIGTVGVASAGTGGSSTSQKNGSAVAEGVTVNDILGSTESYFLRQGYADLEESRIEVTREVFNAPKRRVDHEISRLSDSVYVLLMHCKIIDNTVTRYRARLWACRLSLFAAGCAVLVTTVVVGALLADEKQQPTSSSSTTDFDSARSIAGVEVATESSSFASSSSSSIDLKPSMFRSLFSKPITSSPVDSAAAVAPPASEVVKTLSDTSNSTNSWTRDFSFLKGIIATATTGITGMMGMHWWQGQSLSRFASSLISKEGFTATFSKLYVRPLAENDEFTKALWQRVHNKLRLSVTYTELSAMRRVSMNDLQALERILDEDIANLRRHASPTFPSNNNGKTRVPKNHRVSFTSSITTSNAKTVPDLTPTSADTSTDSSPALNSPGTGVMPISDNIEKYIEDKPSVSTSNGSTVKPALLEDCYNGDNDLVPPPPPIISPSVIPQMVTDTLPVESHVENTEEKILPSSADLTEEKILPDSADVRKIEATAKKIKKKISK